MARKLTKNPNSYGTIANLGTNRRRPYVAKVNPRKCREGHYNYEILGYYEARKDALIALAEYNKSPCNLSSRGLTFEQMYHEYYKDKFERSRKKYSPSMKYSIRAAYSHCEHLHDKEFVKIRHFDLQEVVDNCDLKHSSLELIVLLMHQIYEFAIREGVIDKDVSRHVRVNIPEDDNHGVRFLEGDIMRLWDNSLHEQVRMILMYIYSGWRATELLEIPITKIDTVRMVMVGGKKTLAGKNRNVPIHSKIGHFVGELCLKYPYYLFTYKNRPLSYTCFNKRFKEGLELAGITTAYTPHDCRHTFESMLDDANVSSVLRDRLMGHASKSIGEKVYTHKTIEQLRHAIECIR